MATIRAFALILFFAGSAAAQSTAAGMPDPATGEIDGHPAVLFWPVSGAGGDDLLPNVSDCVVHIEPPDSDNDLEYPCGKWLLPPVGRYRAWLETRQLISDAPVVMFYQAGPFKGNASRMLVPVVPAANARLHYSGSAKAGDTVRYISFPKEGYPFDRDVSPADAAKGVRIAAGRPVIAGVIDQDNAAVAISRPFKADSGHTADVKIESEATSATVYAVLTKPYDRSGPSKAPVDVFIELPGGRRKPDFVYSTPARVFAYWYALPAAHAKLRVLASQVAADSIPLTLQKGKVSTVRQSLHYSMNAAAAPAGN